MTKANNKTIKMMVYMEEDEKESLLGKEDPVKLGIIKLDPEGEGPYNNNDRLGGKTQKQIDEDMEQISSKH